MRKLLWGCAAAAVAAAGGAFGTAMYAERHPDSFVAHCAVAISQVFGYSAAFMTGRVVVPPQAVTAAPVSVTACAKADACAVETHRPGQPCCDEADMQVVFEPLGPDHGRNHVRLPGQIIIPEEPAAALEVEIPVPPPHSFEVADAGLNDDLHMPPAAPTGDAEECEECPRTMPYCSDADDSPVIMPYAQKDDAADETTTCFSFWKFFFFKENEETSQGEESEAAFPPMMPETNYHRTNPHSDCCPYTGRCPSESPATRPEQTRSGDSGPAPKSLEPLMPKSGGEDSPVHSGVDTTEYRPTDASPNELKGKIPF